jgi:predicted Rossmann fold nucleotide-binding protein DprA/Smf involved in DNA uptake
MHGDVPSDDALVLILLTTGLAMPASAVQRPLSLSQWAVVANQLAQAGSRPADLLGYTANELDERFGLGLETATNIAELLSRGVQIGLELERLSRLGIRAVTRIDDAYPRKLNQRLGASAPAVLFVAGPINLLSVAGIAVAGSRDADASALNFGHEIGALCAGEGLSVVSGFARGIDRIAIDGALEAGGIAVGILSDSLERSIRAKEISVHLRSGRMTLATPFHPNMHFTVGNAMARNKLIYCLADAAIVVSSGEKSGGTWAGAKENLSRRWVPLFVRNGQDTPAGNAGLISEGAHPIHAPLSNAGFRQLLDEARAWTELAQRELPSKTSRSATIAGDPGTVPKRKRTGPGDAERAGQLTLIRASD